MNLNSFLLTVVSTPQGYFELCTRQDTGWQQHWFTYPDQLNQIVEASNDYKTNSDVYFSSYLFDKKNSQKQYVLPSKTIQQDLDYADTGTLPLVPTILVQTSPNRHQGFWLLTNATDQAQHELLSKRLAYAIPNCDRTGWPLGHKVRMPDTYNYKYQEPHPIIISNVTNQKYTPEDIECLQDTLIAKNLDQDQDFINNPPQDYPILPYELLESIKDHVSSKVYAEYLSDSPTSDRSRSLFALTTQAFKAGLDRQGVYWLALHSANNKFSSLKFHQDRELAKDVLRAEQITQNSDLPVRELILDLKKQTKLLISERRRAIYALILTDLKNSGRFVKTIDSRAYFLDQGHPLDLYSDELSPLLDTKYGLNKTEEEQRYTLASIQSYSSTLPETSRVASLSYYDPSSNQLLIHTGRSQVITVTPNSISVDSNGTYNILFPWARLIEPFSPQLPSDVDWGNILFGNIPNVTNMSPSDLEVLLKVWFSFLLLRNAASSKPILAFFGSPGSGKTVVSRKIYSQIYGRSLEVSGISTPSNFDTATANLPFLCIDNLDTWEKWVPDRLAQSAGNTDVLVRRLYTNNEVFRVKRQALLAVTAHDPKFGRADVADRLLIVSLSRFSNLNLKFIDEQTLISEVLNNRNKLWGSIIQDMQRILRNPIPNSTDLQLRVQDFAKLGEWIATGLSHREQFRNIVSKLKDAQTTFNLDEDHALIVALTQWVSKLNGSTGPKNQDQIYHEVLSLVPSEDSAHFIYLFKSSSQLIKRIATLQDTLSTVLDVSQVTNSKGQKLWEFRNK